MMRMIPSLGLILLLSSQAAGATTLEALLSAAGLSTFTAEVPAVDFQLLDTEKRPHHLRMQRGKVVFLNFWATWCPPCVHEMPMMEQLHQALRQQPFVMWAVNMQESRNEVKPFMEKYRLHFPALLDADGTVSARYLVRGLPTTYLIDCAGHIVGQAIGARQWTNEATRVLLDALLQDASCHQASPESAAAGPGQRH
jgi:thiol-disulfide isomerase/thioredoxin